MSANTKCPATQHNYIPTVTYKNTPCPPGNNSQIVVVCSRCGDHFTIGK